ncbi:Oxygen sensor protein DosP [compost metagenome]
MSDESIIASLADLRSMGFCISLDDFGTGFSSLSYLRTFPVDLIKIDRSFVAGIQPGASDDTLVRAIIELSHNLGLRVVSEGVELKEQFDLLCNLGSDELQGYFISRPLPAPSLVDFISSYASAASTRE